MSSKTLNTTDASSSRPTFVVNFDLSSVICQESSNHDDLKIFPISILCDGKRDCFPNPGMDDETFPYCCKLTTLMIRD
uniref:Uncharacterized protein n=1 Tax=Romanomermis culicivorax TaxID=13658 RepID=A0A915KWY8_ROMCU